MNHRCAAILLLPAVMRLTASPLLAQPVTLHWAKEQINLVFAGDRSNVRGVQRATIEGLIVSDGPLPGRVLVETEAGGRYRRCRFVEVRQNGSEQVLITMLEENEGDDGDRLEWRFRPARLMVAGHRYRGFEYSWRFHSDTHRVMRLVDLTDWTLGGRPEDLYLVPPRQVPGPDPVIVRPAVESLRTPCFWFQGDTRGHGCLLLAHRFDDAVPWVRTGMSRAVGSTELRFTDEILFGAQDDGALSGGDGGADWTDEEGGTDA